MPNFHNCLRNIVKFQTERLWGSKNEETEKYGENSEISLAFSSTLKTCVLLLQCYIILALKTMRDRSKLSYIASEVILSRNNTIAWFKKMKSR